MIGTNRTRVVVRALKFRTPTKPPRSVSLFNFSCEANQARSPCFRVVRITSEVEAISSVKSTILWTTQLRRIVSFVVIKSPCSSSTHHVGNLTINGKENPRWGKRIKQNLDLGPNLTRTLTRILNAQALHTNPTPKTLNCGQSLKFAQKR
jgi:hypothetical protein